MFRNAFKFRCRGTPVEKLCYIQVFEWWLGTIFMLHNLIILRFLYLCIWLHIKHRVSHVLNRTGWLVFPSSIDFSWDLRTFCWSQIPGTVSEGLIPEFSSSGGLQYQREESRLSVRYPALVCYIPEGFGVTLQRGVAVNPFHAIHDIPCLEALLLVRLFGVLKAVKGKCPAICQRLKRTYQSCPYSFMFKWEIY